MILKSRYIATALMKALDEGRNPETVASEVVAFAKKNHIDKQLPNILNHLERLQAESIERTSLKVKTSHEAAQSLTEKIREYVGASQEAPVESTVEPGLIGGFIAIQNGKVYDASIRSQLRRLKQELYERR